MKIIAALFQLLCASKDCKKNIIPAVTYIACTVSQCAKGEINNDRRKIRGLDSQGMILMAENEEGELAFVSPTKEIDAGNTIR